MSSSLPFTVQDDILQKEKYAASQQQKNNRNCNSRRIRLWSLVVIVSLFTLGLVSYFGKNYTSSGGDDSDLLIIGDDVIQTENTAVAAAAPVAGNHVKEPQTLKEEITKLIKDNQLIVFSKTYCPFSKKAKRILGLYNLKNELQVVEVDLREDGYDVKMILKQISGRDTFPNTFLNGQTLGGSDDLERLHETGQLQALLNENQLLL